MRVFSVLKLLSSGARSPVKLPRELASFAENVFNSDGAFAQRRLSNLAESVGSSTDDDMNTSRARQRIHESTPMMHWGMPFSIRLQERSTLRPSWTYMPVRLDAQRADKAPSTLSPTKSFHSLTLGPPVSNAAIVVPALVAPAVLGAAPPREDDAACPDADGSLPPPPALLYPCRTVRAFSLLFPATTTMLLPTSSWSSVGASSTSLLVHSAGVAVRRSGELRFRQSFSAVSNLLRSPVLSTQYCSYCTG